MLMIRLGSGQSTNLMIKHSAICIVSDVISKQLNDIYKTWKRPVI